MARNVERERKFLVTGLPRGRWAREEIAQGYLAVEGKGGSEVRVRRVGKTYVITVKRGTGAEREEREVEVAAEVGRALWPLTEGRRLEKVRYRIPHGRETIEVDVYRGRLKGLVVAEVEFGSAAAMRRFEPPGWFGREVTGQKAYSNSVLATSPGMGGKGRRAR